MSHPYRRASTTSDLTIQARPSGAAADLPSGGRTALACNA